MKLNLYFFAPFIFGVMLSVNSYAQIEVEKSDKGSSNKVKVFSDDDYFDDGKKSSYNSGKNLIKIDPAAVTLGEIPLFYERRINNYFAAEIGAGPTIANSFTLIFSDFFGLMDINEDYFPEDMEGEIGYTYKAALRIYPAGDGDPEGGYFAPAYSYKEFRFNNIHEDYNSNTLNVETTTVPLIWKYKDYLLQGGMQYEIADNFYLDWYFGLGIRKKELQFSESDYTQTGEIQRYVRTVNKNGIAYSAGGKLGILF